MWPYWMMFLLPAGMAVFGREKSVTEVSAAFRRAWTYPWIVSALAIALLVGLRFEVGGDWFNYLEYLHNVQSESVWDILTQSDPGYELLNWASVKLGWGVFGVNLVSGVIFATALARFCRSLPRPWLALTVAVPYMVIVVAMGYTRQGIALGCGMFGLLALTRRSTLGFVAWIVLGATFHKTSVVLLPIAALANSKNRYWTVAWVGFVTVCAYLLFLQESASELYVNYVETQRQSEGALIRLSMNAFPAALLLLRWKRFSFPDAERTLWLWFALISLGLLAVLYATRASTAVDRLALYILPIQLVVFSRLPSVLGKHGRRNQSWVFLIVLYYSAVQFVWLNFATHAKYWLPYRFYPLEGVL